MSTQKFQRIEQVFHAALELSPPDRRQFVAEQIPDDPALREEVESLLAAAEQSRDFLEPSGLSPPSDSPQITEGAPERMIGPYRLIRELGRGGMGVVYEAEQSLPRRRVALKIVDTPLAADGVAGKLSGHEPRILGRLNHPSVATIYDASQTPDGRSYFVMELIEGERLDEFVEKHKLPRRERLKLFCRICDAIQHAHMKSVIHLDLKPSNILVGPPKDPGSEEPQVKVVDFGVAAITGTDTTVPIRPGETGAVPGTLAYMSPEQRRGQRDAIDVRSDVYSLGVILFKLMTGQLPYPVEGVSAPQAWRIFAEQPPRRPRSIDPTVPKDVETIIRTATAEEPSRRYQSVAELAGDVRRYLNDLPITARQPSKFYEWGKFAKRNKGLVATLSAILAGLVTTIVGTSVGMVRAREAWAAAQLQADNNAVLTEMVLAAASIGQDSSGKRIEEESLPALRRPIEQRRKIALQDMAQGRYREAEKELKILVDISNVVFPKRDWYVAGLQAEYADCLIHLGRFDQAERQLLASYDALLNDRGEDHPMTVEAIKRLARLYIAWGRPDQAAEWTARLPRTAGADRPSPSEAP